MSVGLCRNLFHILALFPSPKRSYLKRPFSETQASSHSCPKFPSKFGEKEWAGLTRSYHLDARRLVASGFVSA